MHNNEWTEIKRQNIKEMKKKAGLYKQVTIFYQGKFFTGTIVSIDLKGIKIKENTKNHTYKWRYVQIIK